jgi:hypothetical protein
LTLLPWRIQNNEKELVSILFGMLMKEQIFNVKNDEDSHLGGIQNTKEI